MGRNRGHSDHKSHKQPLISKNNIFAKKDESDDDSPKAGDTACEKFENVHLFSDVGKSIHLGRL